MLISPPAHPITADDKTIRAAAEFAAVAALLPAVAQLTGDLSLLRDDLRPDPSNVFDPLGGLTEAQVAEAKDLAAAALARFRDTGCVRAPRPSDDVLMELMNFVIGSTNEGQYFELLREELAIDGEDRRAPGWTRNEVAPDRDFRVVIVGAGMSGILAAHRLQQAGVPYTIFEKNLDVGGTWFENTYPGCRVDVPNHLYSYSFAPTTWPQHFSSQEKLLDYFKSCAQSFGVRDHIRFGTEVLEARFIECNRRDRGASRDADADADADDSDRDNDGDAVWSLRVRNADGSEATVLAHALVSAVGQLNRPKLPAIEGIDTFAGRAFHSASWPSDVDLLGKRVAVIGTGASATQLIPEVATDAAELIVFQRTPNWLIPSPEYHDDVPEGMQWLLDHVPTYAQWYRLWLFWRTHEGLLPAAVVDEQWQRDNADGASVSALNDLVRELLTDYLRTEFAGSPELLDQVIPTYPPIAKRVIRDNGIWARTLQRDNVELVTGAITAIVPDGVVTSDGALHQADVIIYGTGFDASHFLTPMKVIGAGGLDLHERWNGDARAYLGMTIPDFPNLFCLYGPNTNIVINGSIIYFSECEVRYVLESIRLLLETGHRALSCRAQVHDEFNERVDAANRTMAWGASTVNSWYKNDVGRVAQNWPFSLLEYWEQTRSVAPDDYDLV